MKFNWGKRFADLTSNIVYTVGTMTPIFFLVWHWSLTTYLQWLSVSILMALWTAPTYGIFLDRWRRLLYVK